MGNELEVLAPIKSMTPPVLEVAFLITTYFFLKALLT